MEWYLKVMRDNYTNFSGRARRKEYWMFSLFFFLITVVIYFLFGLLAFFIAGDLINFMNIEWVPIVLGFSVIIYFLIHLIPSIAVTVRRLHDTGKSGWLYLLAFIPYIGSLIIFIFTVIEGDRGDNKYGPDPKASKISTTQKVTLEDDVTVENTSSNEEISELKNKKRSGSTGWMIFGYIFALLGGPLGIAMGAHYAFWGKNYDANTRTNGIIMLVIGCISLIIWRGISGAL
tara:strand:- start:207 stop:902 length:696 start_codon:yes stop_codon:yes gene_type:complete